MNIKDIEEPNTMPNTFDAIFAEIFKKQMSLAIKYSDIESMGDLLNTTKNNIDTAKGQKWIKDFAWRTTEELAEAFEALELMDKKEKGEKLNTKEQEDEYWLHFQEELADALHFLTELTIIAGYDYKIVPNNAHENIEDTDTGAWKTIYNLGLMCNCLKNKPWKQTQMLTDRPKFEKYLKSTWIAMLKLLFITMGSYQAIYMFYFKKSEVNKFRQRSKY